MDRSAGIEPVKQLKLADAVAAQLEELIRAGHFGESGRLPAERELAEQFGVGRGSMREAVRKLETLGIVVKTHGVGSFAVWPPPPARRSLAMLTAGEVTALELFEVRYALEPEAAAKAAERRTQQDLQDMRRILRSAAAKGIASHQFVVLDFDFHRRVAESAKNRLLLRLYEQLGPHHAVYSDKVIDIPGRMDRARVGHQLILDAVASRDADSARSQAQSHLHDAESDLATAASADAD